MTRSTKRPARWGKYWSGRVTRESDALDVFTEDDPERIAQSLKWWAEHSKRRKAGAFQSAMSMLNFYINRAAHNLPPERKQVLSRAKDAMRRLFETRLTDGPSRGGQVQPPPGSRIAAAQRARAPSFDHRSLAPGDELWREAGRRERIGSGAADRAGTDHRDRGRKAGGGRNLAAPLRLRQIDLALSPRC
jgi:hypothetical protein